MKKYLFSYIQEIDELLKQDHVEKEKVDEHLIKISFFQHERIIHLWVTLAYACFALFSFAVSSFQPLFVFIGLILVLFLVPYVLHYFHLENGVQYLYKQYDELKKRSNK